MDYICSEEFLKQSEKVQDVFKNWLEDNLNIHDWVKLIEEDTVLWVDSVMDTRKDDIDVGRVFYIGKCYCWSSIYDPNIVPLLTETQLREFIEEKLDRCNIYFEAYTNGDTELTMEYECNHSLEGDCDVAEYKVKCNDMLDGYWKIACQIAADNI